MTQTNPSDEDISPELLVKTEEYVKEYMLQYDASHDWSHIERVVSLARRIWETEETAGDKDNNTRCPWKLVHLAALLHDVGDAKYSNVDEYGTEPVAELLVGWNVKKEIAVRVQTVVKNVSFSHEKQNPNAVQRAIQQYPELAIVQDADRLDAIGAVGIARAFTFSAAKRPGQGMDSAVQHFHDKLERIQQHMKTPSGRELAEQRTQRLLTFRKWWEEETNTI